jgi:hypothetical protein
MGQLGSIGTAIATIALVFLFWKTIKQLDETVRLSKIQSNYRFRPWIGPINSIQHMSSADGKEQYSITIKNYGEIQSPSVIVKFLTRIEPIKREMMESGNTETFNLGPLLPNMEKRYWFYIDSSTVQKAKSGDLQVYTLIYFQYEHHNGTSGYGAISRFDSGMNTFLHTDMWVD